MKLLPALCIRRPRFCIAMGLLVASSTLVAVTSQAEEAAQKKVSSSRKVTKKLQLPAAKKKIVRQAFKAKEPRRLTHSYKKTKSTSLSDFVEDTFKRATKRKSFRPAAQHRKTPSQKRITLSTVKQTVGEQSSVQKELKALYSQDGRQMPSMKLKDAPNTRSASQSGPSTRSMQRPGTPATTPSQVRQQPTKQPEPRRLQTQSQPQQRQYQQRSSQYRQQMSGKKPNFFQRLFGRKSKSSKRPYRYKPLPQQRIVQQPTQQQQTTPLPAPVPAPVVEPQVTQKAPVTREYPLPPAPEEFVAEEKMKSKAELVNNETPVTQPKQTASNLDDPFPELSENEADGVKETKEEAKEETLEKPTPFTGLTLKEKAPEEKIISGLKGFCIVTLRDERQLVDAKKEFYATYDGKSYIFSSKAAQKKFEESPALYAPVKGGSDTISLASGEEATNGSLDYAVWYKSKLYLFSSQNNLQLFVQDPDKYHQANTEE